MKIMKRIFSHIFSLLLLCCVALIFFPCKIALAEKHYDDDCTTTYGDYLGTNYIFDVEPKELHVLGDRSLGLHMYASPDLKSEPIHTLESGMRVELLDSRPNAFMVSHAIGSDDGEVTHIQGWVDARFVIESSAIYVAMHPTAIYVAPNTDAKIITGTLWTPVPYSRRSRSLTITCLLRVDILKMCRSRQQWTA